MKKTASARTARTTPPRSARRTASDANPPQDIRDAITQLKRERIVAAAVDLFYHQGYVRTTLDQVAEALKVTKPFIYSHFRSKNELLAEICSRAIRLAHESLNRASTEEGTTAQRLKAVASDFMAAVLSHQAHAVIYSREEKELEPEDRDAINRLRREFDRRLVALIEEGVAKGEFQVDDIHLAALAIGGIIGWSQVWFRSGGRLNIQQVADGVGDLVLAMVRARTGVRRKTSTAARA